MSELNCRALSSQFFIDPRRCCSRSYSLLQVRPFDPLFRLGVPLITATAFWSMLGMEYDTHWTTGHRDIPHRIGTDILPTEVANIPRQTVTVAWAEIDRRLAVLIVRVWFSTRNAFGPTGSWTLVRVRFYIPAYILHTPSFATLSFNIGVVHRGWLRHGVTQPTFLFRFYVNLFMNAIPVLRCRAELWVGAAMSTPTYSMKLRLSHNFTTCPIDRERWVGIGAPIPSPCRRT